MPTKISKCKKHPRYKALRFPTADCAECFKQWSDSDFAERQIICKQLKLLKKINISHLLPPKFTDHSKLEELVDLEQKRRELFQ